MGRVYVHLAACAIAAASLLAGASGAVAAADPTDSAGSEHTNSTPADSDPAPSEHNTDNSTYASTENTRTAPDHPAEPAPTNSEDAKEAKEAAPEEPVDEEAGEKKPVDNDSGTEGGDGGKTINRVPTLMPEAPRIGLAPLPQEVPAPALELPPPPADLPPALELPPPPADLPPALPAAPVDPEVVDATAGAAADHHGGGHEPPVLTAPLVVVAASAPPVHILGASTPPRVITGGSAVGSTPQWSGDPAPRLPRASTSEPARGEQPSTNAGLTARGQNPIRTGYTSQSVRRPLAEMAAGALPGVAGMVIMTASGICLGYRQAMAGQLLRTEGADRFLD